VLPKPTFCSFSFSVCSGCCFCGVSFTSAADFVFVAADVVAADASAVVVAVVVVVVVVAVVVVVVVAVVVASASEAAAAAAAAIVCCLPFVCGAAVDFPTSSQKKRHKKRQPATIKLCYIYIPSLSFSFFRLLVVVINNIITQQPGGKS
jgi:hypothetical protein